MFYTPSDYHIHLFKINKMRRTATTSAVATAPEMAATGVSVSNVRCYYRTREQIIPFVSMISKTLIWRWD